MIPRLGSMQVTAVPDRKVATCLLVANVVYQN
jgi:hypothetical protein